jgi:rhodanese-related sulfurtransferase
MPIKEIDAEALNVWIANGEAVLIDVREPSEYAAQSIPGAVLLPLRDVCSTKLPPHEGKKLVMHCQIGKRGFNACEKLLKEDPNLQIYHLAGGLNAWRQAGQAMLSSGKKF